MLKKKSKGKKVKKQDKTTNKNSEKNKKLLPQIPQDKKIKVKCRNEAVQFRRDFIDNLDRLGYAISDITEILEKGKEKEVEPQGRFHKMLGGSINVYELVRDDLQVVRKSRRALLFTNEAEKTREEYIAKQLALFHASIKVKEYKTASEILDKISKARGIDMSTPMTFAPQINIGIQQGVSQVVLERIEKIQKLPAGEKYKAYRQEFISLIELEEKTDKDNESREAGE